MKLNFSEYRDRVLACWIGKNIGGTMGTPYEGQRKTHDIQGFVTKPGEVLPNDDLDLQLVWLHAMEKIGPHQLDATKLGECWLSYITPHWNEYGLGKANLKRGLLPPLSGDYQNPWKHSNGAWIRTEIWACLAPASPDTAAKYAMEDAMVDHGTGEGTIAAVFVAAMQSAAFVESDIRKVIEVGLSRIPEESRMARSIRLLLECYDSGMDAMEARQRIFDENADIGDGWFEAPSNVSYAVLGMLWGQGDFKKSMITAINCGDDTDCTGATVGATLGILHGIAGIPTDWREYIGDDIVTISIARGVLYGLPNTCTQLTERVVRLAPTVLFACETGVSLTEGASEIPENVCDLFRQNNRTLQRLRDRKPYSFRIHGDVVDVDVIFGEAPDIAPGGETKVTLQLWNHTSPNGLPYHLALRWWLPDGFTVEGGRSNVRLAQWWDSHTKNMEELHVVIRAGETVQPVNRVVLEITADGRSTAVYVPMVLLG